jgi:hypothetical protein
VAVLIAPSASRCLPPAYSSAGHPYQRKSTAMIKGANFKCSNSNLETVEREACQGSADSWDGRPIGPRPFLRSGATIEILEH